MKLIVLLISVFLLSGCASAEYYKYLANKDNLATEYKKFEIIQSLELKKFEAEREDKKRQFEFESKVSQSKMTLEDKKTDNERYLKDKELNTQLDIEKVRSDKEQARLAQEKELKEKEIVAEQKKYEF